MYVYPPYLVCGNLSGRWHKVYFIANKQQFVLSNLVECVHHQYMKLLSGLNYRPHLAKFASEASPGAMAGLVPQDSPVNGTIEVRTCDGIDGKTNGIWPSSYSFQLQCLPLASLLLAMGNPTVNYLSLDLEGAELEVISMILPLLSWITKCTSWVKYAWVEVCWQLCKILDTTNNMSSF